MEIRGVAEPRTQCLICRNHVSPQDKGEDLLERQLRVIYVVSKLLEIPQHFTTRLLAEYGNPGEWATFCAQCHTLVTQGEELFKEIQQLEKKHEKVRDMVRLAMQVKPELDDLDSSVEGGGAATEIREFLETLDAFAEKEGELIKVLASPCPYSDADQNRVTSPVQDTPSPKTKRKSKRLSISNTKRCTKQEPIKDESDDGIGDGDDDNIYSPPDLSTPEDDGQSAGDRRPTTPQKKKRRQCRNPYKDVKFRKSKTPLLTFQEIQQVHKDFTEKLLPLSKTATKEDKNERRRQILRHSLAQLSLMNYIQQFPCQTCPQVFSKYEDWRRHTHFEGCDLNPEHTVKKFGAPVVINKIKCQQCGMFLASKGTLEDHYRARHSPKDIRVCRGCNQNFGLIHEYKKHYRESNSDSDCFKFGLKCPECPAHVVRNSPEALELHRTLHHINPVADPYQCLQCERTFADRGVLKHHMRHVHMPKDQRPFKCERPGCSTSCVSSTKLKIHIRDVHLSKEEGAPTYPCEECGKVFLAKKLLLKHKNIHNPDNPYLCTMCGKAFKIKEYLDQHSLSHVKDGNRNRFAKIRENNEKRKRKLEEQEKVGDRE